ncbi:MAG TPA: MFS transporter [Vicinamibacterales bacterium]|nr:MFS transporter [Vicinamibacterales bacterium]
MGFTGFTLVMPFLPLYFRQLGVTDVGEIALWSGLSLGVTPAITALLAPLWGRLADRFGRKIMVQRSLASFVLVMGAMAYAADAWHVFALRAIQGLFAGYGALTLTMAADLAPRDRMGYAIGVVQTAQRLGPALGPIIGGTVAQIVGLRRAFFVTSGFFLIALLLVSFMYHERRPSPAAAAHGTGRVTFRSVLAFENFIVLMAVIFGLQFVDRSFGPVLPLYLPQLGASPARVPILSGVLFSIGAGSAAVGNNLCARLLARYTARTVIVASGAVAATGALIYTIATSSAILFAGTPLFGLAIGTATTAAYTAAGTIIPASARGAGFGLLTTASLAGLALSPILSGMLGAFSIRAVFLLDVVALLMLAAMVRRLMVAAPQRAASVPAQEEM